MTDTKQANELVHSYLLSLCSCRLVLQRFASIALRLSVRSISSLGVQVNSKRKANSRNQTQFVQEKPMRRRTRVSSREAEHTLLLVLIVLIDEWSGSEAFEHIKKATQKVAESCFDTAHLLYKFSMVNSVASTVRYSNQPGLKPVLQLTHSFY